MRTANLLVMAPFGFSYAVPFQLAGLKSFLNLQGLQTNCLDLNIDFYEHTGLLRASEDLDKVANKYASKSDLLYVGNWENRELYYSKIHASLKELISRHASLILSYAPKTVGFSIFNSNRWYSVELSRLLKAANPKLSIFFGGPDCTISNNDGNIEHIYAEYLREGVVDSVVIGDGEYAMSELLRRPGVDLSDVKSVWYFSKHTGQVAFTGAPDRTVELDSLPYPDYSDFNFSRYSWNAYPLSYSRGCNCNCSFCSTRYMWPDKMRLRSPESIVGELKHQESLGCPPFVNLHGSYFNTTKTFLERFSDLMITYQGTESPRFKWNAWARISKHLTPELLRRLKMAGCSDLLFGLESGSPKVVKDMRKAFTIETADEVIKNTHLAGIQARLFIIVGYPTETEQDFQMTLDFLSRNARYINSAFCGSECILSQQMIREPEKFGVPPEPFLDCMKWVSKDGLTLEMRRDRLNRFYQHVAALGIRYS